MKKMWVSALLAAAMMTAAGAADAPSAWAQSSVDAARAAGLAVRLQHDGGGSDANVLCAHGVRAVALGVGMAAFHSTDEHIAVADLEGSARLVEALITQAARS